MDLTNCYRCSFNQLETCRWLRQPESRPDKAACSCYFEVEVHQHETPTIMITSLPCPKCGKTISTSLPEHIGHALNDGVGYVQELLAHFDCGFRERFISGICEECWPSDQCVADEE